MPTSSKRGETMGALRLKLLSVVSAWYSSYPTPASHGSSPLVPTCSSPSGRTGNFRHGVRDHRLGGW